MNQRPDTEQIKAQLAAAITRVLAEREVTDAAASEQIVTTTAQTHGILYGMITAMMAVLTGWLASVVFRRD